MSGFTTQQNTYKWYTHTQTHTVCTSGTLPPPPRFVHTQFNGGTLILPLTAMTARDWRGSLDFSTAEGGGPVGLEQVVAHFVAVSGEGEQAKFEVDQVGRRWRAELLQVILSHALLRPDRQLCSLSTTNALWPRWGSS